MDKELSVAVMSNQEWLQLLFFGCFLFIVPLVIRLWLSRKMRKLANAGLQPGVSNEPYRIANAAATGQLHNAVVVPRDPGRPGRL